MAFEKAPFGDGSNAGAGNVTSVVSNHYGQRDTGGEQGKTNTYGVENESVVNFTGDGPLYDTQQIPAGAVVTHVVEMNLTGSVSAATVGATDISGADGTEGNYVGISTAGDLTVTGPTAGKVVVKWRKVTN